MGALALAIREPETHSRIIEHILGELGNGRALYKILEQDDDMPARDTFRIWVANDEDLQAKVAHARLLGVDYHVDEAIEIADDSSNDVYIDYVNEQPVAKINGDAIQRAKLRVETRFKRAAMVAPRKYGSQTAAININTGSTVTNNVQLNDNRVQSLIAIALKRRDEMIALGLDDGE